MLLLLGDVCYFLVAREEERVAQGPLQAPACAAGGGKLACRILLTQVISRILCRVRRAVHGTLPFSVLGTAPERGHETEVEISSQNHRLATKA